MQWSFLFERDETQEPKVIDVPNEVVPPLAGDKIEAHGKGGGEFRIKERKFVARFPDEDIGGTEAYGWSFLLE